MLALFVPVVMFGVPGALVRTIRTRSGREAFIVLAAWTAAALPAWLAVTPIG